MRESDRRCRYVVPVEDLESEMADHHCLVHGVRCKWMLFGLMAFLSLEEGEEAAVWKYSRLTALLSARLWVLRSCLAFVAAEFLESKEEQCRNSEEPLKLMREL